MSADAMEEQSGVPILGCSTAILPGWFMDTIQQYITALQDRGAQTISMLMHARRRPCPLPTEEWPSAVQVTRQVPHQVLRHIHN